MLSLLASAGCAGNGQGLDQSGAPIGLNSGASKPLSAELQSIQDTVFTPICARCHIGASAPEGLRLDASDSYNLLVGIPSAEEPSVLRVKPGDPDSSYLIRKLEGGPGIVGAQMPFGGPYLPQATIDMIRQWIASGAQKTQPVAASLDTAAFAVTSTAPMDGAIVTQPVMQMLVGFNHDVDASLVNGTTVTVDSVSPNGAATDAIAPVVSAKVAPANGAVIILTVRDALPPGTYRVRLRGTGGAALADMNAVTLGSNFSFAFTVEAPP